MCVWYISHRPVILVMYNIFVSQPVVLVCLI